MTGDPGRRNVVLVTVDSLRADHCGFMGYGRDTTPALGRLAEESVVFENAVAPAPFTEQSMPAIVTGQYHTASRDDYVGHVSKRDSIAERFSRQGYATAGFSPNPFASRNFGYAEGFDRFEDFFGNDSRREIGRTLLSRVRQGDLVEGVRLAANMAGYNVPGIGNQSIPLRSYYDRVLEWVDEAPEPFFLWLFLLEVHSPYRPTPEYRTVSLPRMLYLNLVRSHLVDRDPTEAELEQLLELYDGTIEMVDGLVDALLDDLSQYDPVLAFTSDHGEAFGEHGDVGHNEYLYEENVHVPLLFANLPASGRVEAPVSLRRVPAMLAEVAATGSLTPGTYTGERVLSRTDGKIAVRSVDRKRIVNADGPDECFDLARDPRERSPLDEAADDGDWLGPVTDHLRTETERTAIHRATQTIDVEQSASRRAARTTEVE